MPVETADPMPAGAWGIPSEGAWRWWLRRTIAVVAVLLVLAAAAVGYVAWTASSKLLLLPRQAVTDTPAKYHLAFREVSFTSRDGVVLRGWFLPAGQSTQSGRAPVLVLSHGRGQSREEVLQKLPLLHRHGFAVIDFDYRACGQSGGTYNTAGYKETWDLIAAADFAKQQPGVDPGRVALVGNSQGAATALLAAASDPDVQAVVEDS